MHIKTIFVFLLLLPISILSIDFYSNNKTILPSSDGHSTASKINQTVKFLANQLSQNKDFANISDSSIAITSFVNVENLKETNKLGNLISEHLIHDMQIRGYRVIDYKTMPDIEVGTHGDYAFSRSVQNLRQDISLSYILTGTYTYYADGVSINARIINTKTNVVASTAQAFIPRADLQYIVDSLMPFDSMPTHNRDNSLSGNMMSSAMDTNQYIVPGVEGHRVKIKKANW
jgi:TolB-like protein